MYNIINVGDSLLGRVILATYLWLHYNALVLLRLRHEYSFLPYLYSYNIIYNI